MDSVKDLLADPLKGKKHAQGILCYLFREVLLWRKVTYFTWNRLQTIYFEKPHNAIKPDKGNLNKALIADDMNWSAFNKAIDFLNPHKAYLDIKLHWRDGEVSTYRVEIAPTDDEANPAVNQFEWKSCELFNGTKPPALLMAHLLRHIVAKEGSQEPDIKVWWEKLFDDYTKNPANVVGLSQNDINKNVQQLRRTLIDPRLSWNGFRRGIHLLRPKAEEYNLVMEWTTDETMKKSLPDTIHPVYIEDPYFVE